MHRRPGAGVLGTILLGSGHESQSGTAPMIWVFLGGLTMAVVLMGVVAAHTEKNTIPVDVDRTWQPIAAFYRTHPIPSSEVDLGKEWTSELDPGAMIALSWSSEACTLVALRRQARPNMATFGGFLTNFPSPLGAQRKLGMKVLAVVQLDDVRLLAPHTLEALPDGLDQLTALLGVPYAAPDPERFGPSVRSERHPTPGAPPRAQEPRAQEPNPGRDSTGSDRPVVLVVLRHPDVRASLDAPRLYASGATLGAALDDLARRKPAAAMIVTTDGALRDDVIIHVNDPTRREPRLSTRDLQVPLRDGDTVTIDAATDRRPGAEPQTSWPEEPTF